MTFFLFSISFVRMFVTPTHNIIAHPRDGNKVSFECVPRGGKRKGSVEAELREKLGSQYKKLRFLIYNETPFNFDISCMVGEERTGGNKLVLAIINKAGQILGGPVGDAPSNLKAFSLYHDDKGTYLFTFDQCYYIRETSIDPYDITVVGGGKGSTSGKLKPKNLSITQSKSITVYSNNIATIKSKQFISINGILCEMLKDDKNDEISLTVVPDVPAIFHSSIDSCGEYGIFSLLQHTPEVESQLSQMKAKPNWFDGAFAFVYTPGTKTIRPVQATTTMFDLSNVVYSTVGTYKQKKYIALAEMKSAAIGPEMLCVSELQFATTAPERQSKEVFVCIIKK